MDNISNVRKLVLDLKKIVGESYVSDDIYERVSYAKDPVPCDIMTSKREIPLMLW